MVHLSQYKGLLPSSHAEGGFVGDAVDFDMKALTVGDVLDDPVQPIAVNVAVVAPHLVISIAGLVFLKVRVGVTVLVVSKVVLGMVLLADDSVRRIFNIRRGVVMPGWDGLVDRQMAGLGGPFVTEVRLSSGGHVVAGDVEAVTVRDIVEPPGIAAFIDVAIVTLDLGVGVTRLVFLKGGVGVAVLVVAELVLGVILFADHSGGDLTDGGLLEREVAGELAPGPRHRSLLTVLTTIDRHVDLVLAAAVKVVAGLLLLGCWLRRLLRLGRRRYHIGESGVIKAGVKTRGGSVNHRMLLLLLDDGWHDP